MSARSHTAANVEAPEKELRRLIPDLILELTDYDLSLCAMDPWTHRACIVMQEARHSIRQKYRNTPADLVVAWFKRHRDRKLRAYD